MFKLGAVLCLLAGGLASVALADDGANALAPLQFRLETRVPGQVVTLKTSLNDWDNPPQPMREESPGVYTLSMPAPWTSFLQYKFIVDGAWQTDPTNPTTVPDGFGGQNSVRETGFAEDPWLKPLATPLAKRVISIRDWENFPRAITLLTGPREGEMDVGCVAIYFLDGKDYLDFTFIQNLLANLRAYTSLPCFSAVMIPPRDREGEDTPGLKATAFARWLAGTVVPEVERRTGAGGSPARRLVIGPSLGGLGALLVALAEPATFRKAASQSGSFWWRDREFSRLLAAATPAQLAGLELSLHVGDLEADILLSANRALRDQLATLGVRFQYVEHPSQHDWTAWRNELRPILTDLFSAR